ncbi:MAG: SMP-30/gluconolactonase/LRE family protein [Pseudomonadota bacterium]|nr:SMP-30/gluconolactonase/LRE family protein [Pseudomonadota bacterium]
MAEMQQVLDIKARLGECPRWCERERRLYWVDINNFRLNRFDPASGENVFITFTEEMGCFALREKGGFVGGMRNGFFILDSFDSGRLTPLVDPEADKPRNRFNDGRCDARGRFWAGTMREKREALDGWLYCLEADGTCTRKTGGVYTSNGVAFSPDNRTLYYSDTASHLIWAFDFDLDSGNIGNRRVFHQFPDGHGRPDGGSVDSEGCYWAALYAGARVVRLSPAGRIIQEIPVPAKNPTMPAFGGPDMRTLYVTTARDGSSGEDLQRWPLSGDLFAVEVDVPGLVEHRFGG